MKEKTFFMVITILASLVLIVGCKGDSDSGSDAGGQGDAKLVSAVEEIAKQGCECQDKSCLFAIKVEGKGIVSWKMKNSSNLTDAERTKYNAAWSKYTDCEMKLTK